MIREYRESDLAFLKEMHAKQGFAYSLPDMRDPLLVSKLVVEENGQPKMAAILRLTTEAYLLLDPEEGTPRERWERLLGLHEATRQDARSKGIADVHAFVPPGLPESFFRRLSRMGWTEEKFRCMWRESGI